MVLAEDTHKKFISLGLSFNYLCYIRFKQYNTYLVLLKYENNILKISLLKGI